MRVPAGAVAGRGCAYRLHRSITLAPGAAMLRVDYRLTSMADAGIAYIWSAHPLFAIEPGMCMLLPVDTRMHPWLSIPPDFLSLEDEGTGYMWPVRGAVRGTTLDLNQIPEPTAGVAIKLWSEPLTRGYVALVASDGEFRFTFDPAQLPPVGLWLNAGGWSGTEGKPYYNLALEPCIGAQDSLEEAVTRYEQYKRLSPGVVHEWWLDVRLDAWRQRGTTARDG